MNAATGATARAVDHRDDLRAIVVRAMTASTGVVSRTREQIADEAIAAMEELGVCDQFLPVSNSANPFAGVNADAMEIIGTLLGKTYQSDEWEHDPCDRWLADWRAARGDAAMTEWRWWIGTVEGETYALDFATRAEAVADAPRAIASGDFRSTDGRFEIVEARCWADEVEAADEIVWFAEKRNREILMIGGGAGQ